MKEMRANMIWENPYSRAKRGIREDVGPYFFRSRWEANFARYLCFLQAMGNIHKWEYESQRFDFENIKRGTRSYLPDFKVWDTPEGSPYFYEIKGWMDAKSKTRLKRMKLYFPEVKVVVIGSKEYREISKKIAPLIKAWEN
jgi:hypothetical protein